MARNTRQCFSASICVLSARTGTAAQEADAQQAEADRNVDSERVLEKVGVEDVDDDGNADSDEGMESEDADAGECMSESNGSVGGAGDLNSGT